MTITTEAPVSAYMADLDRLQGQIDRARLLAVPPGTRAHGTLHLAAPDTDGADAVAAQLGTGAAWTEDHRAYRAEEQGDGYPCGIVVAYRPDPLRLVMAAVASGSADDVTRTLCDSDNEVDVLGILWGVGKGRWDKAELEYQAIRREQGRIVEIAFCPVAA